MLSGLFSGAETGNVVSETLRAFSDEEMSERSGPSAPSSAGQQRA
jgi:hypothetical protein